ncbi:MAG: ABC transporter ATP-binding protein [Mycobacteriales bacterium]
MSEARDEPTPPEPRAGLVRARELRKTYRRGSEEVHALSDVSLQLYPGEIVALAGPSGSGKSTLLNVLCGWETPDGGDLDYRGDLAGTAPVDLAWSQLALVPQALGLLEDLTVEENILMPARIAGRLRGEREYAHGLMERFRIGHLGRRYPRQTSLGEQQRCCVARALLLRPALTLADEPTAHQDTALGDEVFAAVRDLARAGGSFLIATHNPDTWGHCDRVLSMHDGELREGAPDVVH